MKYKIKIFNDKKEKHQSFEASIDGGSDYHDVFDLLSVSGLFQIVGYGADSDEAKKNLISEINRFKEIVKNFEVES